MNDIVHVLSTTNLSEEQLRELAAIAPRLQVRQVFCREAGEVKPLLGEAEVLLTQHGEIDPGQAPHLKWVQLQYAGIDDLIGKPLLASDILLSNASGIHAPAIAEYVLGMMFALSHKFPVAWRLQQAHTWPDHPWRVFKGRELRGETVGILGYGSIGREVGRLAHAIGMHVIALSASAHKRDEGYHLEGTGDPEGVIPAAWYRPEELVAFMAQCDVLVIAAPLTPETRGLVGEKALRAMPRDAYLINIARGAIVAEEALVRALREGWIGGAALDVFAQEPLPTDHPFYLLENVILTPHISAITPAYNARLAALFAANLRRYLAGEPLYNVIDRRKGY